MTDTNKTHVPAFADQQQIPNPKTGKIDRVFVNLEAVYPNRDDPNEEYSFEELRAKRRGWLDMQWSKEHEEEVIDDTSSPAEQLLLHEIPEFETGVLVDVAVNQSKKKSLSVFKDDIEHMPRETADAREGTREGKNGRLKKIKVMEVKGETQTSKDTQCTNNHQLLMYASQNEP